MHFVLCCFVLLQLSAVEMSEVRSKVLRCIGIWRQWGVFKRELLQQHQQQLQPLLQQIEAPERLWCSERHKPAAPAAAAAAAWLSLLQLPALRCLLEMPSGEIVRLFVLFILFYIIVIVYCDVSYCVVLYSVSYYILFFVYCIRYYIILMLYGIIMNNYR